MQRHPASKPSGAAFVLFETQYLKANIRAALAEATLSPWQRSFLSDVLHRLERYGGGTRLSDKQLLKLNQILGRGDMRRQKVMTTSHATPYPRQSRHRKIHVVFSGREAFDDAADDRYCFRRRERSGVRPGELYFGQRRNHGASHVGTVVDFRAAGDVVKQVVVADRGVQHVARDAGRDRSGHHPR
ncbi:hypothetical protein [Rhizobium sp. 007]|uniref:hypothetical protein n=1 Tax=Rhizobium sp. 007 TaxID=2785056 RepID=UPI001FEF02E3|nr:hypothetical protein [Rhizobium sp. 007]